MIKQHSIMILLVVVWQFFTLPGQQSNLSLNNNTDKLSFKSLRVRFSVQ